MAFVAGVLLAVAILVAQHEELLRLRLLLAISFGLLLLALWRARPPRAWVVVVLVAATALLVSAPELLRPSEGPRSFLLGTALLPVLLGWALVLLVDALPEPAAVPDALAGRAPVVLAAIVAVALAWGHRTIVGDFRLTVDETMYLLQARWMDEPGFGAWVPTDLRESLGIGMAFFHGDRMTTQYPPGWPALLWLGDVLHARWLIAPLLAGVTLVLIARIGARVHSPMAGLVAALLVATQSWFLEAHVSLLSHPAKIAALVAAAWLLIDHDAADRHPSRARLVCAGALIAFAIAVRPLAGLAIGLAIAGWAALRSTAPVPRRVAASGWAMLGALPVGLLLLAYNRATTGDPLTLGYTAAHGALQSLGFGERGFRQGPVFTFTSADAVFNETRVAQALARYAIGLALLVPALWLGVRRGGRIRWGIVLLFMPFVVAQFFWFANRPRYHIGLLPFALLGTAVLLAHAGTRAWRLALAGAAFNLMLAPPWFQADLTRPAPPFARGLADLASRAERDGPFLVFWDPGDGWAAHWASISLLEGPRAIVARRVSPAADSVVARRFPRHRPVLVEWAGEGLPPRVVTVAGESRPAATVTGPR